MKLYTPALAALLSANCAANPATCSFADVKAAVDTARPGDTVTIPAGYCNWGANQLIVPAGVTLKGAGMRATVLRRTASVPSSLYMVRMECYNRQRARFSDMTLVGAGQADIFDRGLGLVGGCIDFVVANAKFTRFTYAAIDVRGGEGQRGVIHSSQFIDNYSAPVRNYGYGVNVYGTGTWPALDLGSANAVFVESSYLAGNRHHIAASHGARFVFRHNTAVANDLTKDYPQVDAHGLTQTARGTRSWEVYGNSFSAMLSAGRNVAAVGMRGGDGVVFGNTYTSNIAYPVLLILEGGTCGDYPVADQTRQAHIAPGAATTSRCEDSIALGRDYFLSERPGYTPYPFPHPLRAGE